MQHSTDTSVSYKPTCKKNWHNGLEVSFGNSFIDLRQTLKTVLGPNCHNKSLEHHRCHLLVLTSRASLVHLPLSPLVVTLRVQSQGLGAQVCVCVCVELHLLFDSKANF